ncbi:hypothetical protein K474DRAFT_1661865 [Panus rudis PR-1116 ss-1]|nr:hypothetical protein K474DRAFT_1661865 [Panus rudis PR-1116 ss-1]
MSESTTPVQNAPDANATSGQPSFRLYRAPQSSPTRPSEHEDLVPDASEIRAMQASLSARTQALTNAPLKTEAIRQAEYKARLAKYPTTTIRVRFPDRMQLEKTFPSTDKIKSVYAFVRNALREDVKPIKFVLFQTPPKRELKVSDPKVRDLSLFDLHLAPSSILHLKFLDDSLNHLDVPAPLDASVLAVAEDLPIPPDPESDKSKAAAPAPQKAAAAPKSSTASTSTGEKKVPKWFKMK